VAEDDIRLDLVGLKCPLPALLLERALKRVGAGSIVVAIATDPMAEVDLPFSALRMGAIVLNVAVTSGTVTVTVQKA
jgi:tRNA 2-thiouridine synthesizing protein A